MRGASVVGAHASPRQGVTRRGMAQGRWGGVLIERTAGSLIWIELCLLATFGFLRDMFGVPGTITYLLDAINLVLFGAILIRGRYDNRGVYYRYVYGLLLAFPDGDRGPPCRGIPSPVPLGPQEHLQVLCLLRLLRGAPGRA